MRRALLALTLLALGGCSPLFTGPSCSHAWTADTTAVQGDTTILAHSGTCLGLFQ